jgi:hypothetical protein
MSLAAVLLAGCAGHDFRTPGATGYEWHASMLDGAPNLNSEPGTFVTARCPSVVRDGQWVKFKCITVTVQAEPPGREAYFYVYKVKQNRSMPGVPAVADNPAMLFAPSYGIPSGELAVTAYVVGDRDECMKKSAEHNVRLDGRVNEGTLRLSADPAERCAGPFYIR